jgi:hypothetical protein
MYEPCNSDVMKRRLLVDHEGVINILIVIPINEIVKEAIILTNSNKKFEGKGSRTTN